MNSTDEGILKRLKHVTKEVSLIANFLLLARVENEKILFRLLNKLQKEKDALVKKLKKAKRDSK